ncbi:HAMP domain-containing sensor histidine kinase [Cellulomonas sp. B6]|uniref:sensor histidine kinase n=1 Tax=Cellulomonas sp. B6 TaxID=1295626 RepID=UPI00073B25A3|nr:HAMP domain-containing sensor histidine kinase [Cellulomonas sp. B6]KSW28207.1 histidine kinase [Cellulomonas sp. B6]
MTGAPPPVRVSARLRLALSYALFLVAAGAILLFGVYVVLRYVPDYPLTAANPRDSGGTVVATRGEILQAVVGVSGFALAALAIVGMVGGWLLAGWVLRPLQRITEAVRVAAGDRGHRVALGGRNDEFRQVADAVDHMLDELHAAYEVQERFAANASHELRTPLAVTATMLEVAARDPEGQDYPVLVERLRVTNARAITLTEALLRLADAQAVGARADVVDLGALVRASLAENADEAARRGVTVTTALAPARVVGDPSLLAQLVTNLVQNALRHSGADGRAHLTTTTDPVDRTAVLTVGTTGAVFTPEAAARLVEPFLRGAGRLARGAGGHGLGLALVDRIVTTHDGTLDITPRAAGGLDVRVALPAARP